MYEPKLPVSGYTFILLAFAPLLSNITIILLFVTFLLVFFRFTRLLYKEKNLLKTILLLFLLLICMILSLYTYETLLNNKDKYIDNKITVNNLPYKNSDSKYYEPYLSSGEIIGTLDIDSVSLSLNVLEDSTDENMFIGASHILGTPYPWQNGNSFLASHNVKNYGLLFDRLHEVKLNDIVNFKSSYGDISYIVYDIDVVEPDNISCFKKLEGNRNLSLVTCFNDKRLVVYCKEVQSDFQ